MAIFLTHLNTHLKIYFKKNDSYIETTLSKK